MTPDQSYNPANTGVEEHLSLGDIKGRAVRGVASLLIRQGVIRLLGFIGMLFLARLLAPEMFGIFVVAQFVIMFFDQISNMGLSATLLRKKDSVTEAELRTVFTIQQTVVIASVVIILFAAPLITAHYHLDPGYDWLIRVMGLALFLASLKTIPSILLQRQLRHDKLALAEIAEHVSYNIAAIALAVAGLGVWSLVIATLLRGVAGTGLLFSMRWWRPHFGFHRETAREIMRFGVPIQLANFAVLANNAVIPVLVGSFLGTAAVGYVNFAKKLLDALAYQPLVLAGRVQLRVFGRIQDDPAKLASTVERSLFLGSVIVIYMLAMLAALAEPFIHTVVTDKWLPSLPLIYILTVAYTLFTVLQPHMQLMKALGDARSPLVATVLKFSIEAVTFVLIYPYAGLPGYGFASLLAVLSMAVYVIGKTNKLGKVSLIDNVGPALLAACIAGACAYQVGRWLPGIAGMTCGLVAGTIVYLYVLALLAGSRLRNELCDLAKSVLPKTSRASSVVARLGGHMSSVYRSMPWRH